MKRALVLAVLTAACGSITPTEDPETIASASSACERDGRITVMTQNIYLGANIDPILASQHDADVPPAVAAAWAQMQGNDFQDRARAIAKSIGDQDPAVIGLQEVAHFKRTPHDGGAVEDIDYLSVLLSAIKARGLHYHLAVQQTTSDVTVPMLAGIGGSGEPLLDLVEMIDRDAILVRDGVATSSPKSARYTAALPVEVADVPLEIVRGWASVVVHTSSGRFRFMTTHLEDHVAEIQAAQTAELLAITSAEPLPIILTGDFNSTAPDVHAAGFRDAWLAARPRDPGPTCCFGADLRVPGVLDQRIDFVFARGHASKIPGLVTATLVGERPRDKTRESRWPSDHAGVVASFRPPSAW